MVTRIDPERTTTTPFVRRSNWATRQYNDCLFICGHGRSISPRTGGFAASYRRGRDSSDGATFDACSMPVSCGAARSWRQVRPGGGGGDPRRACRPSRGHQIASPLFSGSFVRALRAAGDIDGALEAVTEGLATIEATGERWWEAELQRLRGMLLMARRDMPGAEVTLRRAIDLARTQQAKSLELRAATSLARLWGEQGRRGEAAICCHPFTAGSPRALTPPI